MASYFNNFLSFFGLSMSESKGKQTGLPGMALISDT